MSKLRVAVLMGGPSPEREVSLRSAQMVLNNLDPSQYQAYGLDLNELLGRPEAWVELKAKADFVFLALHGSPGEDGAVQGLLELFGLPYYGSGVLGSAVAMNKVRAKAIYRELGLPQAKSLDFTFVRPGVWQRGVSAYFPDEADRMSEAEIEALIGETLGWDVVLKGASLGSTLGLAMVRRREDFWPAMHQLLEYEHEILIEERIAGLEVTGGVIGNLDLTALPLIEIRPRSGQLFDYEAKYTAGATEEICPARIEAELTAKVQAYALKAHRGLGCWGVSRSDFIIREGVPYILETNTLPGMTEASLIPNAARTAGIMLPELLDKLIQWGLERAGKPQARPAVETTGA